MCYEPIKVSYFQCKQWWRVNETFTDFQVFKQFTLISIKNQRVLYMKPVDTGRKLNVHKTFRRRPGRVLIILCWFNLGPVSTGKETELITGSRQIHCYIFSPDTLSIDFV